MPRSYESWGRYPRVSQSAIALYWPKDPLPLADIGDCTVLPYGNGRSYGDVCLNAGGTLLDTSRLDRFIKFDPVSGVMRCEAGVLLADILDLIVPQGWFLPVVPGTQFVTVGGAVANDVHGKNHHVSGTFGCHVKAFELLRSDGTRLYCSPSRNPEWFRSTIGGLGLTGMIVWVEFTLKRIANPFLESETIRYGSLPEFFELSRESNQDYQYTVAWVDCTAPHQQLGRGLFMRANHAGKSQQVSIGKPRSRVAVPVTPPVALINQFTLRMFNFFYYHRQLKKYAHQGVHYVPYFFPLDSITHWNRIYGPRGFMQFQCVVPFEDGWEALRELLTCVALARTGSFLGVLKTFGNISSPGLLSFPRPGVTLALDFPNNGVATLKLLDKLDAIVRTAGGAVYPAKDACMSGESFRKYFPHWETLKAYLDPRFSSSFWRRVTGDSK